MKSQADLPVCNQLDNIIFILANSSGTKLLSVATLQNIEYSPNVISLMVSSSGSACIQYPYLMTMYVSRGLCVRASICRGLNRKHVRRSDRPSPQALRSESPRRRATPRCLTGGHRAPFIRLSRGCLMALAQRSQRCALTRTWPGVRPCLCPRRTRRSSGVSAAAGGRGCVVRQMDL